MYGSSCLRTCVTETVDLGKVVLGLLQSQRLSVRVVLGPDEHPDHSLGGLLALDLNAISERFVVKTQMAHFVVVLLIVLSVCVCHQVGNVHVFLVEVCDQLVHVH